MIYFIVHCIHWNYYYFMYVSILFALFRFCLFMFKKCHSSFAYFLLFHLCMCLHIYVYTLCVLHLCIWIHFVLCLFLFAYFYLLIFCLIIVMCIFLRFSCCMYILYEYVLRHKYVFCFAFTCLNLSFFFNSLGVNIHTWARVQVDGIDIRIHLFKFILFLFNSLGVNIHMWARVQVDGIDTDGKDRDKDNVEEGTHGKGRCIQK